MDDRESPTNDLQLTLQGSLRTDTLVEKIKTCLASSPDENENQLNGSKHDTLKSSDDTMGKVEQDSINNNEDSGDYTSSCQEDESDKPSRIFAADEMLILEKGDSEKRSSRKTKSSSRKAAKQEKTGITATGSTSDEDGNKTNANFPQNDPTQTLQALFSLLREEFEQMDSRVLPLCLHEIAETYFQDGEYEKAMKFIQLERLYHEQLLANLSSIQQQWEKKWKAAASNKVPALKRSAKVLNNEEFDKLAKLCTSHQEPLVFRSKLISKEKSLKRESFIGLRISEDLKERGAAACDSDTQTWPGTEPKKENNHKESERCESFQPEKRHRLEEKASLRLSVGKHHMEEERCNAESTLEPPTRPTETLGTPQPGCLSTKDASEDDSLQPREEQFSEDVAKIEAAAEEPAAECSSEPMVDTLVLTDADYMPPDLISSDETVQPEQNLLRSAGSVVISSTQLGSNVLNKHQQQTAYGSDRKYVQGRTSDITRDAHTEGNMPELDSVPYEGIQEETAVLEEERENEDPEDLFDRFFNGCITDREESLKCLASQGDSEILPHMPPEQALYSSSEGYSLDESFSSLDEIAKRIEIAETVPAEGLVSILKKRDDSDAQIQRRESKRRVRFLEMEDTFDQEEVGGGSCVLLILLCVATVFLSVGGTALYCTLGDTESPVCIDFAANMDFYYTRIVQGVEELKHWLSFT
ncbi:consortin isoform X1 [Lacerta agilis]|uniref:consortin isoform X1 n=1 Tax=Lacerta agilis TaxID=80427 RepID=UPI00141953B1|nr:consortin isoform X1 [Lacerta agilis]XP_033000287.1 consortin isoform X1 [Lacerta agilis]